MTRRDFIKTAALFTAGMFLPNETEAATKKVRVPQVTEFKTLDELEINKVFLKFDEMDRKPYTGAIVLHHAGMSKDRDMTVKEIHDLHVHGNHWSGIGYHFVIHKGGEIEFARPLNYRGAHAFKNNEFTVGICLTGNYEYGKPPMPQLKSAVQLVSALCEKYNFPPTDTTIFGHKDFGKTDCPGKNLYVKMPEIIQSSRKLLKLI